MKKRYLILPLLTLFLTSNVNAITSNDVTYDNDGTTESLTTSLDTLYSELKKYKTTGSVEASQMLEGATGYSKGVLVTGIIKSKGAATYTPGTSNQTINAGMYLSGVQTIAGDTNLTAGNIAKGKSIFGVSGTYTSDANATAGNILSGKTAYVNGTKVTGTMTNNASQVVNASTKNLSGNNTQISVPANGYYDTNSKVQIPNSTLLDGIGLIAERRVDVPVGQTFSVDYGGLVPGGYYMWIAYGTSDTTNNGYTSTADQKITITNASVVSSHATGAVKVDMKGCTTGSSDVYTYSAQAIFKVNSSNIVISYFPSTLYSGVVMAWVLYRIY